MKKRPQKNKEGHATEVISGVNPIYEALSANKRKVHRIWVAHKDTDGLVEKIVTIAQRRKIPLEKVSREEVFKISHIEKNQGIAARVDRFRYSTLDDIFALAESDSTGPFILVLDNIIDPQNFGSIIRTAHLTGVHGIVVQERNSAGVGPASSRASAGAIEYIPIAEVINISRTLKLLKKKGLWIVGAEGTGNESLYSHVFSGGCVIVMGSEGRGLRRLVKEECDTLLHIPMNPIGGGVESYNVSVAAAIFLSEVNRQRRYA